MGRTAFSALVKGRVQGVGFRWSALREAERLGLTGWIRNTPQGDVEVWAEGPDEKAAAFLEWLHHGPPHAWVSGVQVERSVPSGRFKRFSVDC